QGMQTSQNMMGAGFNERLKGITDTSKAQAALGEAQAQVLQQRQNDLHDAQVAYQQHFDALDNERQALVHDVQNGYIDPEKYWTGDKNGNGSHSRIATGIGIILAGFNPTNNPNAALEFLKHQMDMNINAQKANLDAKNTLLSHNLRQFGNLKDATE